MTIAQMNMFGYEKIDIDSLDQEDPEVQKQLLRGRNPFRCNGCEDITWVIIGYKEQDFSNYNIHMHLTPLGSIDLETDDTIVYKEEGGSK